MNTKPVVRVGTWWPAILLSLLLWALIGGTIYAYWPKHTSHMQSCYGSRPCSDSNLGAGGTRY